MQRSDHRLELRRLDVWPKAIVRMRRLPAISSAARWPDSPRRRWFPRRRPRPDLQQQRQCSVGIRERHRRRESARRAPGTIASQRVLTHTIASPFFTGPLRSPDRLQNTFANECFMDEVGGGGEGRSGSISSAPSERSPLDRRPERRGKGRRTGIPVRLPNWGNARTGVVTGRGIACVLVRGQ